MKLWEGQGALTPYEWGPLGCGGEVGMAPSPRGAGGRDGKGPAGDVRLRQIGGGRLGSSPGRVVQGGLPGAQKSPFTLDSPLLCPGGEGEGPPLSTAAGWPWLDPAREALTLFRNRIR